MLKNRYRIRCMFFLLMSGVFLPGCLRAVEYKFERWWLEPVEDHFYKNCYRRDSTEGIIIQSNNGNDDGVLRFRLEYRPSTTTSSPHHNHPERVNTQLSVELQPGSLPDDEEALIQQIRRRVPGVDPQEDPVARILNALSSPHLTTSVRRAFISTLAGRYNARITGFEEAEATTVAGVSFLEDLVQLLRILKSRLHEDQFSQLVNAVVQLRIPCFLPEAMVLHQFFPLVHFGEIQNNNPIDIDASDSCENRSTTQISLYTDPAMSTASPGSLLLRWREQFYLEMNTGEEVYFEGRHPSRYFCQPTPLNRWYPLEVEEGPVLPVRPEPFEVEQGPVLPARPEPFERLSPPHFDSGYGSSQPFQ